MNTKSLVIGGLYLIFGLYFVNYPFSFVKIPAIVSKIDPWLIFIGGIFILWGAINYFRLNRVRA